MKFDYNRYIYEYKEWIANNTGTIIDPRIEVLPELEEFAKNGSTEIDCRLAAQNLRYLANWLENCAVVDIADGNASGWQLLLKAAKCEFWNIHIKCTSYDRSSNKRKALNFTPNYINTSMTGLFCLSLNLWKEGAQISKRLKKSKKDHSLGDWESEASVMSLAIALGTPDSPLLENGSAFPNFSSLVDGKSSVSHLETKLRELADYHIKTLEYEGDASWEFDNAPYDIFPVEICAIYKVREKLGLKTPEIDHPLLNTRFGHPPREIPGVEDPLLTRVIEKVSSLMPEVLH